MAEYIDLPVIGGGSGSGDMTKVVYDPANGARQVAFADQLTSGYAEYDYYADLPVAPAVGTICIVRNPTTATYWLIFTKTTYAAGFYRWTGAAYVYLGNTYDNLSEMNDVGITAPAANQFFVRSGDNVKWENREVLSGLQKITVGTTQPVAPSTGDLWIDTN